MGNLHINEKESKALENAEFFRIKKGLDAKVNALFQELKKGLDAALAASDGLLPPELTAVSGRRYQGENHNGFPWRAFDFPRAISGPDIFLYRCLLLWGHGFSFHLILSGKWKAQCLSALYSLHATAAELPWCLDLRESPWEWLPDTEQVRPLSHFSPSAFKAALEQHPVAKLTCYFPVSEFASIPVKGTAAWQTLQEQLFPA